MSTSWVLFVQLFFLTCIAPSKVDSPQVFKIRQGQSVHYQLRSYALKVRKCIYYRMKDRKFSQLCE